MDEQETQKEETQPEAEEKVEEGEEKESEFPALDKAEKLRDEIIAGNTKHEELLKRQEQLLAKETLGGRGEAGTIAPPEKEETPQEYASKLMNGDISLDK